MLTIKNLKAVAHDQEVLDDINLEVAKNEIHAILGPSKSGKTALMYALAGLRYVEITSGTIRYKNKKINNQSMSDRSLNGIASIFQDLIEIPHNTNWSLLKAILKARNDKRDMNFVQEQYLINCIALGLGEDHGDKEANSDGMSFLEAVKNEYLIMTMLQPDLALIDFVTEKLDDEDRKSLIECTADIAHTENRATIVFSNDKSVLEGINPTHVHIMYEGKLIMSGGKELLQRIEEDGYPELSTS